MGRLNNQAHLFLASLIQWVRICAGKFGQQAPSRYKWKVKSKNLVTGRFLGQGCSGIFYETTLAGSHFRKVRLVRKLFPGVKGDIFESEVVRLFELNHHPMIVKTFWWTVDNRSCSLVMEYVRDNLCSVMRKRKEALRKESASSQQLVTGTTSPAPFQLPEAIDLVLQIAKGMQHLHDGGVIHGDLKPNNILIEWEEGRMLVKLADFGLIETKRRTTLVSQRALFSQMIKWSAPELFEDYFASMSEDMEFLWTTSLTRSDTSSSSASNTKNGPEILMEKVDSYSFALTCVYILGGQIMWNGKLSPNELREKILNSDSRPELPLGCPRKLKSLILECWDVDPTLRPTFSVICEKLEEIVKEQETQLDSSDKLQDNVKEQDSELDICCTITSYRSIDMACSSLDLGGHAFAVSTNGVIQPCQIPMLQLPEEEVDAVANPQTFQPPPGTSLL